MLVHGMGTGRRRWAEELAALGPEVRSIAYDRRGYGRTPAPEGYAGTTAVEQGEDLAAVVSAADAAPAILVGEDIGALACLDVLLRRPELAAGAVLVAPPLFSLVPEATDALTAERIALGETLHAAGARAAMEAWLGRPSDAPPESFFADYGGLASLAVTRRELRAIARPVAVLDGAAPAPHVRAAAAALARTLPDARHEPGGGVLEAVRSIIAACR